MVHFLGPEGHVDRSAARGAKEPEETCEDGVCSSSDGEDGSGGWWCHQFQSFGHASSHQFSYKFTFQMMKNKMVHFFLLLFFDTRKSRQTRFSVDPSDPLTRVRSAFLVPFQPPVRTETVAQADLATWQLKTARSN